MEEIVCKHIYQNNSQNQNQLIEENISNKDSNQIKENNYSLYILEGVGNKCKHCNKHFKIIKIRNHFDGNRNIILRDKKEGKIIKKENTENIGENEVQFESKEIRMDKKDVDGKNILKDKITKTDKNHKRYKPEQSLTIKNDENQDNNKGYNFLVKQVKENQNSEEQKFNKLNENIEGKNKGITNNYNKFYEKEQYNKNINKNKNNYPEKRQQIISSSQNNTNGDINAQLSKEENNNGNDNKKFNQDKSEKENENNNIHPKTKEENNKQNRNDKYHLITKITKSNPINKEKINNISSVKKLYINKENQINEGKIKQAFQLSSQDIIPPLRNTEFQKSNQPNKQYSNNPNILIQSRTINIQKESSANQKYKKNRAIISNFVPSKDKSMNFMPNEKQKQLYPQYSERRYISKQKNDINGTYQIHDGNLLNTLNNSHKVYGSNDLAQASHEIYQANKENNMQGNYDYNRLNKSEVIGPHTLYDKNGLYKINKPQELKEIHKLYGPIGINKYYPNNIKKKIVNLYNQKLFVSKNNKNPGNKKANPIGNKMINISYRENNRKIYLRNNKSNEVINQTKKEFGSQEYLNLRLRKNNRFIKCEKKEVLSTQYSLCPKSSTGEINNIYFQYTHNNQNSNENEVKNIIETYQYKRNSLKTNFKFHEIIETSNNSKSKVVVKKGGISLS